MMLIQKHMLKKVFGISPSTEIEIKQSKKATSRVQPWGRDAFIDNNGFETLDAYNSLRLFIDVKAGWCVVLYGAK